MTIFANSYLTVFLSNTGLYLHFKGQDYWSLVKLSSSSLTCSILGFQVQLYLIFHMFISVMDMRGDVLVFDDMYYEIKFPHTSEQTINMVVQSRHSWKLNDKNIPRTAGGPFPHLFIPHPLKWNLFLAQARENKVEWLVGFHQVIKGLPQPFKWV